VWFFSKSCTNSSFNGCRVYVNIFEDQEVFQNLPAFADWPTFPQIYFNSELVGGGDIIVEMAEMGTLQAAMEAAAEKFNNK